jgi:hypothetical protein
MKNVITRILWHGVNEQLNSEYGYFDYYLDAYEKKLNFIHLIIHSCKHLRKEIFL